MSTVEQAVCVSLGVILQALTFSIGLLVGAALRREPDKVVRGKSGEPGYWHDAGVERR
jgi:hypothetical protein